MSATKIMMKMVNVGKMFRESLKEALIAKLMDVRNMGASPTRDVGVVVYRNVVERLALQGELKE